MPDPHNPRSVLWTVLAWSTLAQIVMVVTGHYVPGVSALFGPLGMTISLLAGVALAALERPSWGRAAGRGAVVGGACALIGIAVSFALGDVTAMLLALGTASSAVAGALGGAIGRAVARPDRSEGRRVPAA